MQDIKETIRARISLPSAADFDLTYDVGNGFDFVLEDGNWAFLLSREFLTQRFVDEDFDVFKRLSRSATSAVIKILFTSNLVSMISVSLNQTQWR